MNITDKVKEFFDKNNVEYFKNSCTLKEEDKSGKCKCTVLMDEGILFKNIDNNKCKFFEVKNASDYFILKKDKEKWYLKIVELKTKVNAEKWETIKLQFMGTYLHAICFSKFLDIEIEDTEFITVFAKEDFNRQANLSKLKAKQYKIISSSKWEDDTYIIKDFYGSRTTFAHKKECVMTIDEKGNELFEGTIAL